MPLTNDMSHAVPLSLGHRAVIEANLRRLDMPLSEYCFANLYLFRAVHGYSYVADEVPHILGSTYDGERHAMPLGPLGESEARRLLERSDCIYPVTESMALEAQSYGLQARWNDDDSDYIYDAGRLAQLQGRA